MRHILDYVEHLTERQFMSLEDGTGQDGEGPATGIT